MHSVPSRAFAWEGQRILAPGGDLKQLCHASPLEIWNKFKQANINIQPNTYNKIRSCLTEVYLGYLQEARQLYLLDSRQVDGYKRAWKSSGEWKELGFTPNITTSNLIEPQKDLSAILSAFTASSIHGNFPITDQYHSEVSSDGHTGFWSEWNPSLPYVPKDTSQPTGPPMKAHTQARELLDSDKRAEHQAINRLSKLTPEETADLWLDYNLRSVLEAIPPRKPRDLHAKNAVQRARPYLLSIKTKLFSLLADNVFPVDQITSAIGDIELAWDHLAVVVSDEECDEE